MKQINADYTGNYSILTVDLLGYASLSWWLCVNGILTHEFYLTIEYPPNWDSSEKQQKQS